MSQKSYDGSPTLFLIPTPIGNMDDITLRAIKTLEQVEVIFSEDTRVTAMLLKHLGLKKKLISNHKFNENENKQKLEEYLQAGFNVGLVTDRGTPIISDPGEFLVKHAINKEYNVVSLPGATALIPALTTSGLESAPFLFFGFLDSKSGKRQQQLEELKWLPYTTIIYESPHRLKKTLSDMQIKLGDRNVSIAREISKKFEEIYRGTISEMLLLPDDLKGELVIVIDGNKETSTYENVTIKEHVSKYINEGVKTMDAIKIVSKERNIPKSEVYNAYHNDEVIK